MSQHEETSQILADNIIDLRKMRGLTQSKLATLADIPRSTITYLESGAGNPSLHNMIKISKALEVKVEELFVRRVSTATLVTSNSLEVKTKNNCQIFNILPTPVKGLTMERFEFEVDGMFTGIPHLKGSTEYFCCILGKAEVTVAGKSHYVDKGDVLIFLGNEKHSYRNVSNSKTVAVSVVAQNK
jgi:DNA-binding XRE family transcriptional regulator